MGSKGSGGKQGTFSSSAGTTGQHVVYDISSTNSQNQGQVQQQMQKQEKQLHRRDSVLSKDLGSRHSIGTGFTSES